MKHNRRKYPRKQTRILAHVIYHSERTDDLETTIGKTKDLSKGGAQLKLPRLSAIKEIRKLVLKIPGYSNPIKTTGELQWKSEQENDGAVGVRFTSLSSRKQKVLERFLGLGESNELIRKATLLRFQKIKTDIRKTLNLSEQERIQLEEICPLHLYEASSRFGISSENLAELIAEHLEMKSISNLQPDVIKTDRLPAEFCHQHRTVSVKASGGHQGLALSNPFKHMLYSAFHDYHGGAFQDFWIVDPDTLADALRKKQGVDSSASQFMPSSYDPYVLHVHPIADEEEVSVSLLSDGFELKDLCDEVEADRLTIIDSIISVLLRFILKIDRDKIFLNLKEHQLNIHLERVNDPEFQLRIPNDLMRAVIIRVKILAGIDITDQRGRYEGRFPIIYFSERYDVRVSITAGRTNTASLHVKKD